MLVYTPFALCFVYTLWCFYAFSGTNLLTRCHSASSYFLLFLCFRKVTQEIFSELDETKAGVPNYLTRRRSPKESRRQTRGRPHLLVARAPLGRATRGCDRLVHPLTSPFRLFNPLDGKTLRARTLFQKTYYTPPPSSTQDREGPEALPDTLPERGITTGGYLHRHACLRSDVWVVYLGLWVHSSS
jgi:hypothetical protein